MPSLGIAVETLVSRSDVHDFPVMLSLAAVCWAWYSVVALVCSIGFVQVWRNYSRPREPAQLSQDAPHVTVIRPIKGLEPCVYECLASTFQQQYPRDRLHVRFCISDRNEPSLPVLERLLHDFPEHDAQILVEDEDAALEDGGSLGPNPKIRNMSRAYREAIGDIVWIIDCNIWVAKGVCGRMVARLLGDGSPHKNKFVHQLPLVVDTDGSLEDERIALLANRRRSSELIRTASASTPDTDSLAAKYQEVSSIGGGRLEESFMSSSHAKFYTAINTVLIAPCIVGKSTMFRPSHLNALTDGKGIDYFSENICEDHLIGDLLWKRQIPAERQGEKWGKHALCYGDLAIQPMANMSIKEYWNRRVRWLRVRKFTVTLATLVEPGTESFLCSLYGAFAFTTLPFFQTSWSIPPTWMTFAAFWLFSVSIWCLMDWTLYQKLHSADSIAIDDDTPAFAKSLQSGIKRPFSEWVLAWLGRETLALPIWVWAFWGGTQVEWRGRKFWVGLDMRVHEIVGQRELQNGHVKARRD
ncbi:glycosyltransferase family 21 protein [Acrodontium crateriforme]|uniref:Ceramide glucosyltransferase n=1 Tax=Acrodontium crateriforme TaxID=150365 RepID=A0AAQ3M8J1_9PEZI|nr:glycosyltransferase family 21 protein [Acrodontium crateriforme]